MTVALGSRLATILLISGVSWAEGAIALVLLVVLQLLVAWRDGTLSVVTASWLGDASALVDVTGRRGWGDREREGSESAGAGVRRDVAGDSVHDHRTHLLGGQGVAGRAAVGSAGEHHAPHLPGRGDERPA